MFAELLTRLLARRFVRWVLIALFNLIGFTSVVGIPVAAIIDILLLLAALQGIFAALRGTAVAVGSLAAKLFRVAAIGVAFCTVIGVTAAIAIPHFALPHTAQAAPAVSAAMPAAAPVEEKAGTPDLPVAQQVQDSNVPEPPSAPAPTQSSAPSARDVIALIDDRNYGRALALIDAGVDIAIPVSGRTPLTALELDHRPTYYSEPDAYRLMKRLAATSSELDQRLDDFGRIMWHQLMYELENDPQKFADILDILLARGVDINQKNFHGQTLADTQMWPYTDQDIMITRGACRHLTNPVKPEQPVCPK